MPYNAVLAEGTAEQVWVRYFLPLWTRVIVATSIGPFLFAIPSLYALEKSCQGEKNQILLATE